MKCAEIKRLIFTGYMDNELNDKLHLIVGEHLKTCSSCRQIEKALRDNVSLKMKSLKEINPPESVWHNIQVGIEKTASGKELLLWPYLKDALLSVLKAPRPAYALAASLAIALFIFVSQQQTNKYEVINQYLNDQAEFFLSLENNDYLNEI